MPSTFAKADGVDLSAGRLVDRFLAVRARTEALAAPIRFDHQEIQTMADVSPTKWNLGHTTWFFETFILGPNNPAYRVFEEKFNFLFNSYYEAVGERQPRPERWKIKDPDVPRVLDYRAYVTEQMAAFALANPSPEILGLLELGCHHEEQHQELLLTDIKHALYFGADKTPYNPGPVETSPPAGSLAWQKFAGGLHEIGGSGKTFCFDCETPRHKVFLEDFEIADRVITAGEYLGFIEDGGYGKFDLWLSDGWDWVQEEKREAPLYWEKAGKDWQVYTMRGLKPLDPNAPVCHLSYYEAEAFARWAGARLPTEAELEVMAVKTQQTAADMVWQWSGSAYLPYPGFKAAAGAVGEYNGKFMCNQMVLRGGSGATPQGHWRPTYRNFFYPGSQWQFTGVRLAR